MTIRISKSCLQAMFTVVVVLLFVFVGGQPPIAKLKLMDAADHESPCPSVTQFDPAIEPNWTTHTCFCDPVNGSQGNEVEIQCFYGSTLANLSQAITAVKANGQQVVSVIMNNMDFPELQLPDDYFAAHNVSPHTLSIFGCGSNDPFNITDRSLAGLQASLRNLSIVACVLKRVPEAIRSLRVLDTLELQHNQISAVRRQDLEAVAKNLRNLDISRNMLRDVENGTLSLAAHLETLILSHNHLNDSILPQLTDLQQLRHLDLTDNAISLLRQNDTEGAEAFANLGRLEELDISMNKIGNVSTTMFAPLPSLKFLDLNLNTIEDIEDGAFAHMPNLTTLKLEGAYLTSLRPDMFRNMSNLATLRLGWNELKALPRSAFAQAPNLQVLELNSNRQLQLIDPDALRGLKRLEHLNLSYTSVLTIDPLLLKETRLKELDLSSSELEMLPVDTFQYTPDLERLFINNTKLISLPATVFDRLKRLKEINLSYNQWLCDTTLEWLSSWLRDKAVIIQNAPYVSCEWPVRLRGLNVASVNDTEFTDYEYDETATRGENDSETPVRTTGEQLATTQPVDEENQLHSDMQKPCNIGGHEHASDQNVEMGTIIVIVVVILVVLILIVLALIVIMMRKRRRHQRAANGIDKKSLSKKQLRDSSRSGQRHAASDGQVIYPTSDYRTNQSTVKEDLQTDTITHL